MLKRNIFDFVHIINYYSYENSLHTLKLSLHGLFFRNFAIRKYNSGIRNKTFDLSFENHTKYETQSGLF